MPEENNKISIDAKTFMRPLAELFEALAQKVHREGIGYRNAPRFVAEDLFMMMRQSLATYDMMFYINADERRDEDCHWHEKYGVVTAPAIRSMIDAFYNITAILEDPVKMGTAYRCSGFAKAFKDIDEDVARYSDQQEWRDYLEHRRKLLSEVMRLCGLNQEDLKNASAWKTLGKYIADKPLTPHKEFLKKFTYLQWRQYSALAHCAFEAYVDGTSTAAYFIMDNLPHNDRPKLRARYPLFLTRHVGRAATILIALATEIQAYFRFKGANLDRRISDLWQVLYPIFEANELYEARYFEFMKEKGFSSKDG